MMNSNEVIIEVMVDGQSVNYHAYSTRAPEAYDGFMTFTIYKYDAGKGNEDVSFRIVMIREEHVEWQRGRYSSGMFASTPPEDWQRDDIIELLWKRIQRKEG